jgi:hypothetical protein
MKIKDLLKDPETAKQVVLGLHRAPGGKSSFPVKTEIGIVQVEVREVGRHEIRNMDGRLCDE